MNLSGNGNQRFLTDRGLPIELLNAAIGLELPASVPPTAEVVAGFMLAANILSRLFSQVTLFAPDAELGPNPWHLTRLSDLPVALTGVSVGTVRWGGSEPVDMLLGFGGAPTRTAAQTSFVAVTGWAFAIDQALPSKPATLFAALAAACYGASQVFLHAAARADAPLVPMRPFSFSLLDYSGDGTADVALPREIDLGESHLVGVGAVGSAAAHVLGHLPCLKGTLHAIDNDFVEDANAGRYIAVRAEDVARGAAKVQLAVDALSGTGLKVIPYVETFAQHRKYAQGPIDLLLTPVDSEDGRRALAGHLPRRVINAATGGPTVTISTHGFADGHGCLACLYPPPRDDKDWRQAMAVHLGLPLNEVLAILAENRLLTPEILSRMERHRGVAAGAYANWVGKAIQSMYGREVCGSAGIPLPGGTVVAPLPFISALAGVLMAAELVKERVEELQECRLSNYFRLDLFHGPNPDFRQATAPINGCICADQDYVGVYRTKWGLQPLVRPLRPRSHTS